MHWYVDSHNGRDANDGRSAASAFQSLQHAGQAARPGDSVLLVPGLFEQDLLSQISRLRTLGIVVGVAGSES